MYCRCIWVTGSLGAVVPFVVLNDFWRLNLVDLFLRDGVFIGIKYLFYLAIVGVFSSVVAFCAFIVLSLYVSYGSFSGFMIGRSFVSAPRGILFGYVQICIVGLVVVGGIIFVRL